MADDAAYEARGKRDPFVPLIGMDRPVVTRLEDVTSIDDVKLEGIAMEAKGRKVAILNAQVLKEGDRVGEVEVVTIQDKSATVNVGGKTYTINLYEEGGKKSER